jgi:hypothetical protein
VTHGLSKLPPLTVGRVSRIVFGVGVLAIIPFVGTDVLGVVGTLAVGALGVSFLVGGLMANPGCELTALLNLFLPRNHRVHFM